MFCPGLEVSAPIKPSLLKTIELIILIFNKSPLQGARVSMGSQVEVPISHKSNQFPTISKLKKTPQTAGIISHFPTSVLGLHQPLGERLKLFNNSLFMISI